VLAVLNKPNEEEEEAFLDRNSEQVMAAFAQATTAEWGDAGGDMPAYLPPGDDNTVRAAAGTKI